MNKRKQKQPPPCGCVLKPVSPIGITFNPSAAASVRLCVETPHSQWQNLLLGAAASVRLCVETEKLRAMEFELTQPPPCGCVLKPSL